MTGPTSGQRRRRRGRMRVARRMAAATVPVFALGLAACGTEAADSDTKDDEPVKISVTIDGTDISTKNLRVSVKRGQPVEFDLTATGSGELHAHSTPPQSFDYEPGNTTITLDPMLVPGIVEVEEENLGQTIVQLQVD